jgi:hypothetical protein
VAGRAAVRVRRASAGHGTYYVYWYWNCRCDPCKATNAAKSAALAAKKQQRMAGPTLPLLLHSLGDGCLLAPRLGLEPRTVRLTAGCSAN